LIAATNRDLENAVREGAFRKDLFYRLNVFPIHVPPLRERKDDISELLWFFVRELGDKMGKSIESISKKSLAVLQRYDWPGNVRELRNIIERAIILCRGSTLHIDLAETALSATVQGSTLEEVERRHILDVLNRTYWRISGTSGAAEILGLKPTTLRSR
jgi:transcriptional regulator with GAF, ATPase, and Fis domain